VPGERQQPAPPLRETGVAQVMTSTKVDKHPTAFTATGLPILQVALNVKQMTARLAPLLGPLNAANGDGPVPAVSYARLLAYKQGNRGAIRYDVTGLGAADPGGGGALLGKLYPQASQAQRVDAILRGLWNDVFAASPGLGVPRPIGCLPELSMLLYVPVEGDSLDEVLAGADQAAAVDAVERTAGWLAALHRARLLLDRRFSLATEVVNLQAWAALVARTWPAHGAAAARLSADLQAAASSLKLGVATAIHKDFQYKHVLVDGDLRVIDFDEVRLGDPPTTWPISAPTCACSPGGCTATRTRSGRWRRRSWPPTRPAWASWPRRRSRGSPPTPASRSPSSCARPGASGPAQTARSSAARST
jgi:hypothetical protein